MNLSPRRRCCGSWQATVALSLSFMFAYTSYMAIQSFQSSLNQEAGLGVVSLACLYGTIILSGMFTPSILRLVGSKNALIIAMVCHALYTGSNFYPTWATLVPSSILLGGIAGPMWTAQGLYITESGESMVGSAKGSLHAQLSKLNGVFFMCYESTQITGNLISSLVLTQGNYTESANNTCGADDCPSDTSRDDIVEPDKENIYILLGVFLACDLFAVALTCLVLPPIQQDIKDGGSPGVGQILFSWFTALSDPKLIALVPCFVSFSMAEAVLFADFTKSFVSCTQGVAMLGFVMAAYGAMTTIVSTITIRAVEITGRYVFFCLAFLSDFAVLIAMLLWEPYQNTLLALFLIAATSGIASGVFHTQLNCVVGIMFPNNKGPAFANCHTWIAAGFTVVFAYGEILCVRTKVYISIGVLIGGFAGYIAAEILFAREQNRTKATAKTINANDNIESSTHL